MSETLLGCPHCGKPVGFTAAMAGQVVACPHCRGQFQMPDRPPATPPAPPRRRPRADEGSLAFDDEHGPADRDSSVKAELGSYRAAATLATILAIGGSVVCLLGAILAVVTVVLPLWKAESGVSFSPAQGLIWIVVVFAFAFLGIAGLFLVRACVLVGVDAARTLRTIERDAAAVPKSK